MLKYKDLEVRAAKGLHEDCLSIIQNHVPSGSTIVDLAAGAGAFSCRLVDTGYDVTSNDIDEARWNPTHIPKLSLDLDKPLEPHLEAAAYRGVVAMEVIEHLENPSKLLKHCKRLVSANGVILISTPNVMDLESRLIFLRSGFFFHISPQSYFETGHRTILPYWLLELLIDKAGLEIIERHWGGHVPRGAASIWRNLTKHVLRYIAKLFVKPASSEELHANYVIYLLRVKQDRAAKSKL